MNGMGGDPVEVKVPAVDWSLWMQRALHIVLVFGSAYVVANPKMVWMVPPLQALGQGLQPPR